MLVELLVENYAAGCAVGVTTLESAATSPRFQKAVAEHFAAWTTALAARFTQRGVPPDRAAALADFVVAAMEGATMLARAQRDPLPLRHTADMLEIDVAAVTGSG